MNTSLTRGQIQFIKELQQKEGRNLRGQFIVEGEKMVNELLGSSLELVGVYFTQAYELPNGIDSSLLYPISQKDLERISALKTPNKVLAVAKIPNNGVITSEKVIYCCNLQDPGNAGTVSRIADWFGITDICLTEGSVDIYSPKAVQASMGAVFRINCHYDNSEFSLLNQLKNNGYFIYAADMEGTDLGKVDFKPKVVLVMGSESHGIIDEIRPMLNEVITIPGAGESESLNVGVASGIICYKLMNN